MNDNKNLERFYNTDLQRLEVRYVDRREKERYYVGNYYDSEGINPFVEHIEEFLAGYRTVPVSMSTSISTGDMYFTFTDDMLRVFLDDFERIKKPYECALKYGFRGYSKGGKNGVYFLRKQVDGLVNDINSLKEKYKDQIVQGLDCSLSDLPDLKKVKIVYHAPSGERVVGVMNDVNGRAIFLGFGHY